jgi:hypothetical protein
LKVRERQFKAAFDPTKTAAIARAIVAKKIAHENHSKPIKLDFLTTLRKAQTTDDIRLRLAVVALFIRCLIDPNSGSNRPRSTGGVPEAVAFR